MDGGEKRGLDSATNQSTPRISTGMRKGERNTTENGPGQERFSPFVVDIFLFAFSLLFLFGSSFFFFFLLSRLETCYLR